MASQPLPRFEAPVVTALSSVPPERRPERRPRTTIRTDSLAETRRAYADGRNVLVDLPAVEGRRLERIPVDECTSGETLTLDERKRVSRKLVRIMRQLEATPLRRRFG